MDRLEKTIVSVIDQDYINIEYIVIDGASNDGSYEIIEKYQNDITYWCSEPDKGIYHGMNKGIKAATGTWLMFLNTGDILPERSTLTNIFSDNYSDHALIYGHTIGNGLKEDVRSINRLKLGRLMASHQAMFFNKDLLKGELKYDQRIKFSADAELVIRIHVKKYSIFYLNKVFSEVEKGNRFASKEKHSIYDRFIKVQYIFRHLGLSGLLNHFISAINLRRI